MSNHKINQIEKYLGIIEPYLEQYADGEKITVVSELFETSEFDEFMEKEKISKENSVEYVYFYLKEKVAGKDIRVIFYLMVFVTLVVAAICLGTQWKRSDALLLIAAPSAEEVCELVRDKYGVKTSVDDVLVMCEKNDDHYTNEKYPRLVMYKINGQFEEREVTFAGKYIPFQDVAFDLEGIVIEECLSKYFSDVSECEVDGDYFRSKIREVITSQEEKEEFLLRLEDAMEEVYSVSIVSENIRSCSLTIYTGEGLFANSASVYVGKNDIQESIEELSEKIDEDLEEALDNQELLELMQYLESYE